MRRMSKERPFKVVIDRNPTLRLPFPWHVVWWVVAMLVLLVVSNFLSVVFTSLWYRSRMGRKQGLDQLMKKTSDRQALL
mgnify:CR=1 FL=1